MDAIAEIKKLYYGATRTTIKNDVDRAIDLLKTLGDEEEREKVAVYMDGLSQMRSDWANASPRPASSLPKAAAPRTRSGRSKAPGRPSR